MLDKLQKQVCTTADPSLETLSHQQNVACLTLFFSHYFCRCLSKLAEMGSCSYSHGSSTCYSHRLHDFPITIP